ncbi:replication factor-A protein [Fennellomyces sp. T-0311]|nr:replication factor-A protein [Fennellomyces sp. T-0311]
MTADMLTKNAIKILYEGDENVPKPENPVLQVINVKSIQGQNSSTTRYRVILSDGDNYMQAMLCSALGHLGEEGAIPRGSIIRLTECNVSNINNRKILIIVTLDVVDKTQHPRIGNPQAMDATSSATTVSTSTSSASPSASPALQHAPVTATAQSSGRTNFQLESSLFPITGLNPYQNKWTIKARVTVKSDIKQWQNQRSEGKLFNIHLLDKSGEIKATAFNDQVDRLYHMFEEGKVYYLSKARVTMARKQYSTLDNEYELVLENSTEIELCGDEISIPKMNFNFVRIADVDQYEKNASIDMIGVVREDAGIQELISKASGRPLKKRDLMLVDDSLKQIKLTLWDKAAEEFESSGSPVCAFRGLRVSDFGGRSLSLGGGGTVKINPDIPEANKLKHWYASQASDAVYEAFSQQISTTSGTRSTERISLDKVKQDGLGQSDRADYFSAKATIVFLKQENCAYPACPECRKKTLQDETGWRCEKCDKSYPEPQWRYLLTASVEDATSQLFVNMFDEVGAGIVGVSATEAMRLKDSDADAYAKTFNDALFKVYNIKVKAKSETYNDTARTKYTIIEAAPINYVDEAKTMVAMIDKLSS